MATRKIKARIILIGQINDLTEEQMTRMKHERYSFEFANLFIGLERSVAARRIHIQNCMASLPGGPLPLYDPNQKIILHVGWTHAGVEKEIVNWIQEEKEFTPGRLKIGLNGSITVEPSQRFYPEAKRRSRKHTK